jgi:thiamine biosynthesis protein ThiS
MKIKLNNRDESFDREEMSLEELIREKNYTFKLLVTKVNGTLIRKENRSSAMVKDGDVVTILHMISGG